MIIGDKEGRLHYFSNQAGTFLPTIPNFYHIDVGNFAQPQLIDVNRDGMIDIIIGEENGTINYCPNSGTTLNAVFDTIITNFGGIDIENILRGINNTLKFLSKSNNMKNFDWKLVPTLIKE